MEWQGKVAVVTGANSGIGFGITERLLEMGLTVVGLDKDLNNLEGFNANLHPYKVDLIDEHQIAKAFQWIDDTFGRIDVLINNAGLMGKASLLDGNMDEMRRIFGVNTFALAQCTSEAVKVMRKRQIPFGNIINITSRAAQLVSPHGPHHTYGASKFAARSMTEGFRFEFLANKLPIRITSIEPGLVKSNIFKSSLGEEDHEKKFSKRVSIEPTDVAHLVQYLLNLPEHVSVSNPIVQHRESDY